MVFDALKSVDELQEAGIPEAHAKAQIRILQGVIESDLATKRDLEELRKATAHDLNELRQATKLDLKELELRLTIKLGAIMMAAIGLTVVLLKLKII